jgi:hypothetical protein
MSTFGITILLTLTIALVLAGLWRAASVWRRFRETRLVTCPATGQTAAVKMNASHAAFSAVVEDRPDLHFADCSRWSTGHRCGEECMPQVQSGDNERTVSTIVGRWFAGQTCVQCGKPIDKVSFLDHHAALGDQGGATVEWTDVAPETLPAVLQTRQPVCWDCHVAESFRRLRPELVVDRPQRV